MVKWACDPGLLLVQAAWKNLTWEPWIAIVQGVLQLYLSDFVFSNVEKAGIGWNLKIVWGIDSSFWKSSFSCSILCVHIPVHFWTRNPSFPSSDKLYNKKPTSLQKYSTYPWNIPQIPIPNSLCWGIPESLGLPGVTGFREFLRFSMAGTVVGSRDEKFGNDLESNGYLHRVSLVSFAKIFPATICEIWIFFNFPFKVSFSRMYSAWSSGCVFWLKTTYLSWLASHLATDVFVQGVDENINRKNPSSVEVNDFLSNFSEKKRWLSQWESWWTDGSFLFESEVHVVRSPFAFSVFEVGLFDTARWFVRGVCVKRNWIWVSPTLGGSVGPWFLKFWKKNIWLIQYGNIFCSWLLCETMKSTPHPAQPAMY